jgi:hypothetical protein
MPDSRAEAGAGATGRALGSQNVQGNMPALAPKPAGSSLPPHRAEPSSPPAGRRPGRPAPQSPRVPSRSYSRNSPTSRGHAADDRHRQIGVGRPEGLRGLVLGHPHVGGEGHHFQKKTKRVMRSAARKTPIRAPRVSSQKKVVALLVCGAGKVYSRLARPDGQPQKSPPPGPSRVTQAPLPPTCSPAAHAGRAGPRPVRRQQ